MNETQLAERVTGWLREAGARIKTTLKEPLTVETKTSRKDLVTNVDKATEAFFVEKIRASFPEDQILGEEGLGDQVTDLNGRVWIIDPIDGTLNFVKQHDHFCLMIGIVEDGKPVLGFIYELMRDALYWGGPRLGVYCNQEALARPADVGLREGLVGLNSYMYAHNVKHLQEIGDQSSGVRMIGCAGIEFIQLLKGNLVAYVSHLAPWDYAAGTILIESLGLTVQQIGGKQPSYLAKELLIAATPTTARDIQNYLAK